MNKVDATLWTTHRAFGVAGGPDEIVLTQAGEEMAYTVGSHVSGAGARRALKALVNVGGYVAVETRVPGTARLRLTEFGKLYVGEPSRALKDQGLVEEPVFDPHRGEVLHVRITEAGALANQRGEEEMASLLRRVKRAAGDVMIDRTKCPDGCGNDCCVPDAREDDDD